MSARRARVASNAGARWRRIWATVERVPRGRVATYGQIATLAGIPGHARQVGYALAALPDGAPTPWQRVVNAAGGVSERATFDGAPRQRLLLLEEGVVFGVDGRIELARFQWKPRWKPRAPGKVNSARRSQPLKRSKGAKPSKRARPSTGAARKR